MDPGNSSVYYAVRTTKILGETIALMVGEYPAQSFFTTGWRQFTEKGKTQRILWILKIETLTGAMQESFAYLWSEEGWEVHENLPVDSRAYAEVMDYQNGFVYVGANLFCLDDPTCVTYLADRPIMLFYCAESNMELVNNTIFFLRITNQLLELKSMSIVSDGLVELFVQDERFKGYYLRVDLNSLVPNEVVFIKEFSFFDATQALIQYGISVDILGTQELFYIGEGNDNVCTQAFGTNYGFVNKVITTECPCLLDDDVTNIIAFTKEVDVKDFYIDIDTTPLGG